MTSARPDQIEAGRTPEPCIGDTVQIRLPPLERRAQPSPTASASLSARGVFDEVYAPSTLVSSCASSGSGADAGRDDDDRTAALL